MTLGTFALEHVFLLSSVKMANIEMSVEMPVELPIGLPTELPIESPVESKADATIEFGAIWKVAINRYEEITMVKIQSLAEANNVDEILNDIHERETKFKGYRHDGSKLEKFRTLVSKSLNPIEEVGDMVASAASTVRKQPLPAH